MRLSEKTLELTFCNQAGSHHLLQHRPPYPWRWPRRFDIVWFGLTQRQEAQLGFDMAAQVGGRVVILQFKASNTVLRSGDRRFTAAHQQLRNLQRLCRGRRAIYYVLPNLGTSQDLITNPCIIPQCWFLDVAVLPTPFPPPTIGHANRLRKSHSHYIDLRASWSQVVIHSEPVRVRVKSGTDWLTDVLNGPAEEVGLEPSRLLGVADEQNFQFGVGAIGGIIHDREGHP